jgi:hypothetical protein
LTVVAYIGNLSGSAPATVTALAWTAVVASLVALVWAWWADRHRTASVDA